MRHCRIQKGGWTASQPYCLDSIQTHLISGGRKRQTNDALHTQVSWLPYKWQQLSTRRTNLTDVSGFPSLRFDYPSPVSCTLLGTVISTTEIGILNEGNKPRSRCGTPESKKLFLPKKTVYLDRTINWSNNRCTIPSSPNLVRRRLRSDPIKIRTPRPVAGNVLIKEYLSFRICSP